MTKKRKFFYPGCLIWLTFFLVCPPGAESLLIDNISDKAFDENVPRMVLEQAVVCEGMASFQPLNPAVVFSISQGEVFCFTSFDQVHARTPIYHHWYNRDKLVFSMRLMLSPPKWSCFSKIQIREADKGPWRVEILDENMIIIKTLRFSMVD